MGVLGGLGSLVGVGRTFGFSQEDQGGIIVKEKYVEICSSSLNTVCTKLAGYARILQNRNDRITRRNAYKTP